MKVDLVSHAKRKGLFLVHPSDDIQEAGLHNWNSVEKTCN